MIKRLFDFCLSAVMIFLFGGVMLVCIFLASIDTKSFGLFIQNRVGQGGKLFKIFKIKTLSDNSKEITAIGRVLRATKLDELPQLINIFLGDMSFVGPRPDIEGYADLLKDEDRIILAIKPGITGLASLKYRNEEAILQQQKDPLTFNDTIIWPDKIRINRWYVQNHNLWMDLKILFLTVVPMEFNLENFTRK